MAHTMRLVRPAVARALARASLPSSASPPLPRRLHGGPLARTLAHPVRVHARSPLLAAAASEMSTAANPEPRFFTSFDVYKGKAALNVKPVAPTFAAAGRESSSLTLQRAGGLMFEMAPSSGTRQYDWTRKVVFMCNVIELGDILAMGTGAVPSVEFVHDPAMGSSEAGQVMKKLKLTPTPDGKGLFLNMSVRDKANNVDDAYSAPLTWGEFAVLKTLIEYTIPRALGYDRAFGAEVSAH